MFSYETNNTLAILFPANMHPFLATDFFPNAFMMVNAGLVLLSIPIINYCLVPCLPKLTIRARLGMGLALYCVGSVTIIVIHAVNVRDNVNITAVQFYFLILPTAIYSFAESLTIVASEEQRYLVKTNVFGLTVLFITHAVLEFIYAQSPESMKGFLTGLFFFILGLSNISSSVVFYKYPKSLKSYMLLPYHVAFTIIQVQYYYYHI